MASLSDLLFRLRTLATNKQRPQEIADAVHHLNEATAFALQATVSSVKHYGVKGDGSDDTDFLQAAIDAGGGLLIPDGVYYISKPLNVRLNKKLSLFGPDGSRPTVEIKTMDNFDGYSMIRQWDESWYAGGETDRDVPPANLTAYTNSIDRYINIKNIRFTVAGVQTKRITPIDLVSMQETSLIEGCVFASQVAEAGTPIRCRATSSGAEVSLNGFLIRNCTVYGAGWRSQLVVTGSGSDLVADKFTTSNAVNVESPIQLGIISARFNDLHCEAYAIGLPTIAASSGDVSLVNPLIVLRNLQGNILETTISTGTNARVGFTVSAMRLLPEGGNIANVTNSASINVLSNLGSSATLNRVVPLLLDGNIVSFVYFMDRNFISGVAASNGAVIYKLLAADAPSQKLISYIPPAGSTATKVLAGASVVLTDDLLKRGFVHIDWSAGSASGSSGADYFNNPQRGRITLYSSFNGSETRRKVQLITDQTPAIFGSPVWDATAGTLTLSTLVDFTNAKFNISVIGA